MDRAYEAQNRPSVIWITLSWWPTSPTESRPPR